MAKESNSTKRESKKPMPLSPKAGFKPGKRYGNGGKVKIGIPLSDKAISLDEKDLLSFKEGISNIV